MKKIAAIGFALLMVFAVFVPFVSANDGEKETKGYLYVDLACRSPQIGGEFTIAPVIVTAPFTDAARVDAGFVNAYVKVMTPVETKQFLPNGQFDMQVNPGTYLLTMKDGNGGQPEFALVTVNAGEKETVVFLGHGISGITEDKKVVVTITEATYGMTKVVVDHEAYTEFHGDYNKVSHHGCTNYVYVGEGNGEYVKVVTSDYEAGHVHAKKATGSAHDFKYHGDKYQIVGNEQEQAFIVYNYYMARLAELKEKTTYEFVGHTHHDAETHVEGEYVDVTNEVQQAVDMGATSFKFRNDFPHKGIVTTDNQPLVEVADPAPGQVKAVHIEFTVDGVPKTIDTQEYEVINLL